MNTKILTLKRIVINENYVIGRLYAGTVLLCNTLEPAPSPDPSNPALTVGRSCIAEGLYRVRIGWSHSFQRNMPRLDDVPGRSGILIHCGNSPRDTRGCILLGRNADPGRLIASRQCFGRVMALIADEQAKGREVWLRVVTVSLLCRYHEPDYRE